MAKKLFCIVSSFENCSKFTITNTYFMFYLQILFLTHPMLKPRSGQVYHSLTKNLNNQIFYPNKHKSKGEQEYY